MDLSFLTAAELPARAYESGVTSPVEVTRALLDRIAAHDGALHSFILVTEDVALAEAAAAERELRRQAARAAARHPLRAQGHHRDRRHPHHRPFETAPGLRARETTPRSSRRLKAGGGVLLGKLATWEFALGGPSFDLPWPPARNPWNTNFCRAARRAAPGRRWRPGLCPARSAPIPAARCAARRRFADSPGSSRPTAGSAAAASFPTRSRWIIAAR